MDVGKGVEKQASANVLNGWTSGLRVADIGRQAQLAPNTGWNLRADVPFKTQPLIETRLCARRMRASLQAELGQYLCCKSRAVAAGEREGATQYRRQFRRQGCLEPPPPAEQARLHGGHRNLED